MKDRFTQTAMAMGLFILIVGGGVSVIAQGAGNPRTIEGVWRNRVTVTDCLGHALASFPGLLNYHKGGTMSETGGTNAALRSPGYGSWEFRGGQTYSGKFTYFTFSANDGSYSGRFEVNQNIVISNDGSQLKDTATADIFDPDDNLLFSVCATAEATRFR